MLSSPVTIWAAPNLMLKNQIYILKDFTTSIVVRLPLHTARDGCCCKLLFWGANSRVNIINDVFWIISYYMVGKIRHGQSKLCNLNLLNATPSLISQNP